MADVDIDLYDTIEDDFPQQEAEAVPAATNGNDLYDDVITSKPDEKVSEPKSPITAPSPTITTSFQTSSGGIQPRKHSIYVSNLTWWTNDEHVINACKAVGVLDILEVKFYENRANGQSRGFATVSTSSEETKQKLFEGLRSQSIHGQQLRTHYWTKSNLAMLDTASGGTRFTGENAPEMQQQQPGPRFMPPQRPPMGMGPRPQFGPGGPMRPMGGPMMGPRPGPMPGQMGMPGMGMANGQAGPMGPRPPMQQPGMMPPMQRPGMHPMQQQQQQQQPQMIQQNRPPMQQSFPTSQPYQQPGMQQQPGMGPGPIPMQQQMPAMSQAQPAPHVNPAFFPGGQAPQMAMQQPQQPTPQQPVMVDPYGRPIDANQQTAPQIKSEPVASSPQLSDVEFQEILTRNKSVSSSAISRAVQDASQGDFASAIETLVTAISLIKQSKIANDDRCKILIASLQDTKQGIEDKSYGGGSSRYRDNRSYSPERRLVRSRSRDRDYSAPARKRERSRSRDRDSRRDYRERSREKDSRGYYQESRSRDRYH